MSDSKQQPGVPEPDDKLTVWRLAGEQRKGWRRWHVVGREHPAGARMMCGVHMASSAAVTEVLTAQQACDLEDAETSSAVCIRCMKVVGLEPTHERPTPEPRERGWW